jgi:hypothetical protein
MSTDANDKVQSKFPRASLRARNKTMMITPADVADFQVRPDERGMSAIDLDDIFEDSLVDQENLQQSSSPESTRVFDNMTGDKQEVGKSAMNALQDALGEEIEDVPEVADPIIRSVRSTEPVSFASFDKPTISGGGVMGQEYQNYSGGSSSILDSAAEEFADSSSGMLDSTAEDYVDWRKETKLVGFLVSYARDPRGSYVELREGRLLVSNAKVAGDSCLVIRHESVSPMHAIMRVAADGSILILDQLSERGTRIHRVDSDKEESLMGDKSTICHGDVVVFGECEYHVVILGSAALRR